MRLCARATLAALMIAAMLFASSEVRRSTAADDEPDDRFSKLDTNSDGVLSGREARGLMDLDTDKDGDITRKEFLAGNRRDRFVDPKSDPKRAFRELDENSDGVLSGRERKGIESYDADSDGDITEAEFVAARAKLKPAAANAPDDPAPNKPGPDSKPNRTAPVVRTDPRLEAWDNKLRGQFDAGKKWAILIGVNAYAENPLKKCVPDAKLMADTLTKYSGYTKERILLLTDDQEDANRRPTKANLQQQSTKFLQSVSPNDTVLFYFSGHGMQAQGQSLLCPLDFNGLSAQLTGWRIDEVRTMLNDCDAAQKLVVLDCCHSGGALTTSGFGAAPQDVGAAFATAQGLITLAACRTNQTSLEVNVMRNSIFTDSLGRGLAGEADSDGNRIVDSDELYRFVLADVQSLLAEYAPEHEQIPVRIIGQDVVGVFALADVSKAPATPTDGPGGGEAGPGFTRLLRPGDSFENSLGMKFVVVPSGVFVRGSTEGEEGRNADEAVAPILLTKSFRLGMHEVTQSQYEAVMRSNPSDFSAKGEKRDLVANLDTGSFPVEQVSWRDAKAFCDALSKLPAEREAHRTYRLPTEAEWEYACRAGTTTPFSTGETITSRDADIPGDRTYGTSAAGPTLGRPTNVGMYAPNRFGLYDMHGNVAEWCNDRYEVFFTPYGLTTRNVFELVEEYKKGDEETKKFRKDPQGEPAGDLRVYRGGSFQSDPALCRSAARLSRDENYKSRGVGIRVVCITPR